MTRNRFFATLLAGLLILGVADRIHRGAGKAILTIGTMSYVLYGFWNYDKPWARRMLNKPKSWWMN